MKSFSMEQLRTHLMRCGLQHRQNVFVHTNLSALGLFLQGPSGAYGVLREILGEEATIVAPAYRITASPEEIFDPIGSPSLGVGSFSEFLRQKDGAIRSLSPIHSHVFDGPLSVEASKRGLSPSFGEGSDFEFLAEKSFRSIFLGCNFQTAGTMVFHAQAIANNIPYREWQTACRRVKLASLPDGEVIETEYSFPYYARKASAPRETRHRIEACLEQLKLVERFELPYGSTLAFDYDHVSNAILGIIRGNSLICVDEDGHSSK